MRETRPSGPSIGKRGAVHLYPPVRAYPFTRASHTRISGIDQSLPCSGTAESAIPNQQVGVPAGMVVVDIDHKTKRLPGIVPSKFSGDIRSPGIGDKENNEGIARALKSHADSTRKATRRIRDDRQGPFVL